MSDPTAQEPTMEEILASIRRIISEDDAPAAADAEEPAHEEPKVEPAPSPVHLVAPVVEEEEEEEDDVLDLTEPAPKPAETHGDLDVFAAKPELEREPAPAPAPAPKPEPIKAPTLAPEPIKVAPIFEEPAYTPTFSTAADEPLMSHMSEDRVASHFGKLAQSIIMPAGGRTLEDVVSELLKPLLKDWLDQHLPGIVEQRVQDEVERISRRRV